MKLNEYFRKLKGFLVLHKQLKIKGIKNPRYYSYNRKIFFNFLLFGLFTNEFKITFGSDYWSHVPKYIFFSLPEYIVDFINYKGIDFYYNKVKHENAQFLPASKPNTPSDLAMHKPVWEGILEYVANENGFEIVDEKLTSLKSVYTLTSISN